MKKFILLVGNVFYPCGWDDFKGYFDSIEEAKKWVEANENEDNFRWAEIIAVDKIVLKGNTSESDYCSNPKEIKWIWYNE
jgi:hypothetical protein